MRQWLYSGQLDAGGSRHGIYGEFTFRILQWPGLMVNLSPINDTVMHGVEAISFAKPVLEGGWISQLNGSDRPKSAF